MPLEATQHTPEGAKAFAEFFIKTIDWGYATTSGAYIRHLMTSVCAGCSSYADTFDATRRRGNHYIGARMSVTKVLVKSFAVGTASVVATVNILSVEQLTKSGNVVLADVAHNGVRFDLSLVWHRTAWHTQSLALEA